MPNLIGNAQLGDLTSPGGVQRWVPQVTFLQRIPTMTRIGIRQAAKADPLIEDFLDLLRATVEVNLDDPDVMAGVQYLLATELLTQAEAEVLLG